MDSPASSPAVDGGAPLFLIGFMGVGKTTVGRLLASRLGRRFLDLDTQIEADTGETIGAIFAARGEDGFRAVEAAALRAACRGDAVVAVGGGAPAYGGNLAVMRAAGTVVLLAAETQTLLGRLESGGGDGLTHRPLLQDAVRGGRLADWVATLHERRASSYAQADVVVETDGLLPDAVAERVLAALGLPPVETVAVAGGGVGPDYQVILDAAAGAETRMVAALLGVLPQLRGGRLALVTDENVAPLHLPRYAAALASAGVDVVAHLVPPGEGSKSLAQVERSACALLGAGISRDAAVLALGGGVVSDLAGFLAATLLRGLPWVVAPTTLLSQVDAAIGGKTAVNLPLGKNLIGAFHSPLLVYADVTALRTLPPRDRIAGLGEVIKHALLLGEDDLAALEADGEAERAQAGDPATLARLIRASCRYKAQVVASDPHERTPGGRAVLNLGHTLGHALESTGAAAAAAPAPLLHGEAVALGLLAAARIATHLGVGPADLEPRLRLLLPRLGLPVDLDAHLWDPQGALRPQIHAALGVDKKRTADRLRFILLTRPGHAQAVPVDAAQLPALLRPKFRLQF